MSGGISPGRLISWTVLAILSHDVTFINQSQSTVPAVSHYYTQQDTRAQTNSHPNKTSKQQIDRRTTSSATSGLAGQPLCRRPPAPPPTKPSSRHLRLQLNIIKSAVRLCYCASLHATSQPANKLNAEFASRYVYSSIDSTFYLHNF